MPWTVGPVDSRTKLDDLATPDDNKDLNATILRHGLMPKLSGRITDVMNGRGQWIDFGSFPVPTTFVDAVLMIVDDANPAKVFQLQLDGLSVGNHTYRPPPGSAGTLTLAAIDLAQTFTAPQTFAATSGAASVTISAVVGRTNLIINGQATAGFDMITGNGSDGVSTFRVANDGLVVLRRDYNVNTDTLRLYNQDTTDLNGNNISFHTELTGAGSTAGEAVSLAGIRSKYEIHNFATRRGRLEFQTANAGNITVRMRIEGDGRVALSSSAATARLDIINPTSSDTIFKITGAAGQSASMVSIINNSLTSLFTIGQSGELTISPANASGYAATISPNNDVKCLLISPLSGSTNRVVDIVLANYSGSGVFRISGNLDSGIGGFAIIDVVSTSGNVLDASVASGGAINVDLFVEFNDFGSGGNTGITLLDFELRAQTASVLGTTGWDMNGIRGVVINTDTSGGVCDFMRGGFFTAQTSAGCITNSQFGFAMVNTIVATGTATNCAAINLNQNLNGSSTNAYGFNVGASLALGGTIGTYKMLGSGTSPTGAGTVTNFFWIDLPAVTGGPTITNAFGLRMGDISRGSTANWSFDIGTSSSCAPSRHFGKFFFGGTTTPTAKVHIAAGSTSTNSAPVKLTAGDVMTAAETGAVEYDGSFFYVTPGSSRQAIATDGNVVVDGTTGDVITVDGQLLLAA